MTIARPDIDYVQERLTLRKIYVTSSPRQRLGVIRQRLNQPEIGATRLVTCVSSVEALARSLVVHAKAVDHTSVEQIYSAHRDRDPESLVAEYLRLANCEEPRNHFTEDTWPLFREAINFRNQVVHECTYLGQDKYPTLIEATLEILEELIRLANLHG
jgi:uncharacterized protein YutE (UPF0331/DUF86 family)